jgi:AraC-like DNA-binding protein
MYNLGMARRIPRPPPATRLTVHNPARCDAGGVTLAGYIYNGRGVTGPPMRTLGRYAVVLVLGGGGSYADDSRPAVPVVTGDLLLILPDVPHTYGPPSGGRWDEFYVVFDGGVFDAWRSAGLLATAGPQRRLLPVEHWRQRLEAAAGGPADVGPTAALAAACRVQQFLVDALVAPADASGDERRWLDHARAALDAAAHADRRHLAGDPVRTVAGHAGVSYESFRKRFAAGVGVSPGRYLSARVIERACGLLHAGDPRTLADLADALGFCDAFHFSRQFKQYVGMSPRAFREQLVPAGRREGSPTA